MQFAIAMSAHSSDLKAALEDEYEPSESTEFVDNTDERQLSNWSSCWRTHPMMCG